MNFPPVWINQINVCLSSASFSVLVNGHNSDWFSSSRGVRQGNPISLLLFLLVTQNLSAILSKALDLQLVLGFYNSLPRNFNHLMFTDDLILIIKTSRKATRNSLFCFNLYHNLTGQKSNPKKSQFYLPSWANKSIAKSISRILGFSQGNFPLIYLGVPISPKCLPAAQFTSITNKVSRSIYAWNHSPISIIGWVTLINSMILSIPTYLLSVMHILFPILNEISKLAHSFLQGSKGNSSGFHSVSQTVTTL